MIEIGQTLAFEQVIVRPSGRRQPRLYYRRRLVEPRSTITAPEENLIGRLEEHYNAKYAGEMPQVADLVTLAAWPRDRFEAVVRLAWSGGDTLLEIGAGSGNVLRTVRPRYRRCVATELSRPRAVWLRQLFEGDPLVDIIESPIEDGLPPDIRLDVIVLNAVVEHLVDPIAVLTALSSRLSPSGRLIITTPNAAKWTRRVKLAMGRFPSTASRDEGLTTYEGTPTDLYDEGHLHYFTFRSLTRILSERCGLTSVRWFGYPGRAATLWPTLFSTDVCVTAAREDAQVAPPSESVDVE